MTPNNEWKLLQNQKPTNKWLVKDDNKAIIRAISKNVENPTNLKPEELNCLQRLIDFVRYSQDSDLNFPENNNDYLRPAVGLAANQIGVNKNMFYIKIEYKNDNDELSDIEEYAMINAKIITHSEQMCALNGGEGCLSVDKDRNGIVRRYYKIVVEGYEFLTKRYINLTLRGYSSIVFQHEINHINGGLYYDLIDLKNPNYAEESLILI